MSGLLRLAFLVAGVAVLVAAFVLGSTSAAGIGVVLVLASLVRLDEWGNYQDPG